MAFPAGGITASGAGTAAVNGFYAVSAGNDANGNAYGQIGSTSHYCYWSPPGSYWLLGTVLGGDIMSGSAQYYGTATFAAGPPTSGWSPTSGGGGGGAAPAPTLAYANTKVVIGGGNTIVPATGTTAPSLGTFAVYASDGVTVIDRAGAGATSGLNGLFQWSNPSTNGGNVYISALSGAAVGVGYIFRASYAGSTSSGVFDVVAAPDTTAPVPNTLSFSGTTGTLTWIETQSPPVLNVPLGLYPASITTINPQPGTANTGGTYIPCTGGNATYGGAPQYTNGIYFITYGFSQNWVLSSAPNITGVFEYSPNAGPSSPFPLTGWSVGTSAGTNPPPTFSSGGNTFTPNQGLTITGLSGGTVTVSNVVTSGTTTTFTTSRTISSSETGGTFYSAVGDFSDSAASPNLTAAFSIPIVPPSAPSAPAAPTFGTITNSSIQVIISALTAFATSINLQRSIDNVSWATIVTGITPSFAYRDSSGISQSTTYYYRLVMVGLGGSTTGPSAFQITLLSSMITTVSKITNLSSMTW